MNQKPIVDLNARAKAERARRIQQGGAPNLPSGVTDPRAVGYAAGVQSRGELNKYTGAVAGGPPPHMPALEHQPQVGMTMEAQADTTRRRDAEVHARTSVVQQSGPGSIIAPDVQGQAPMAIRPQAFSMEDLTLLPGDLLPPEASKDPAFKVGMGSQIALSQPHLAIKYGVIRSGQRLRPIDLMQPEVAGGPRGTPNDFRGRPSRSKGAIAQDLRTAMSATPQDRSRTEPLSEEGSLEAPQHLPRTNEEADAQARQGPAGVAERVSGVPTPAGLDEESISQAKLTPEELDLLRKAVIEDILRNPKQKEIVEARLDPLSIDDLIMHNKVKQRVPIIPGKFEPVFESMQGDVELALKRLVVEESKSVSVTEDYFLSKFSLMNTAAGLIAINQIPVPNMFNERGEFKADLFWAKFNWVSRRPIHMLASLGIHYAWFEMRVRRLFKVEEGKDG
jgi:hypothetical protein